MTKAAIYVRVSHGIQKDNYSLPTQIDGCEKLVAERGYELVGPPFEEVQSAMDEAWHRPVFMGLLDAIARREFEVLVVYVMDRFGRHPDSRIWARMEVMRRGGRVEPVLKPRENTPEGGLVDYIDSYSDYKSVTDFTERGQRGRRARAEKDGKPIPGPRPPYGYAWVVVRDAKDRPHKEALKPDPFTAPVVERIFREYAAGVSLFKIATGLSDDTIPTPTGKQERWAHTTVRQILLDERYDGRGTGYRWRAVKQGKVYKVSRRSPEEQLPLKPERVPALIDRATFDVVAARFEGNKGMRTREHRNPALFLLRAGHIRCGLCGRAMATEGPRKNGRKFYRCTAVEHPTFSITAPTLDAAVWRRVERLRAEPEVITRLYEAQRGTDPMVGELERIERQLSETAKDQERVKRHVLRLDDEDAAAPFYADLKRLAERKRSLEAERADAIQQQAAWVVTQTQLDGIEAWARDYFGRTAHATYEQKREALSRLGMSAIAFPKEHFRRYQITTRLLTDTRPWSERRIPVKVSEGMARQADMIAGAFAGGLTVTSSSY